MRNDFNNPYSEFIEFIGTVIIGFFMAWAVIDCLFPNKPL